MIDRLPMVGKRSKSLSGTPSERSATRSNPPQGLPRNANEAVICYQQRPGGRKM